MKVLFLTTRVGDVGSEHESYLEDSLLIGIKRILGDDCIDYPKKESLYTDCEVPKEEFYGNGFTIWKRISPKQADRHDIEPRIVDGEFDLIVFGNIQWQLPLFRSYREKNYFDLNNTKFAFLDGVDFIPKQYIKKLLKRVRRKIRRQRNETLQLNGSDPIVRPIITEAVKKGYYFKRELIPEHTKGVEASLFPTGFAVPEEIIRNKPPQKQKKWSSQVQCETAAKLPALSDKYSHNYKFESEDEYYDDIAEAIFSITRMKGGWDRMRHYEIAANLSIPCFCNIHQKPQTCAPHGLRDMYNCVSYRSATELRKKTEFIINNGLIDRIIDNIQKWIRNQTTRARAIRLLRLCGFENV